MNLGKKIETALNVIVKRKDATSNVLTSVTSPRSPIPF